MDGNSKDNTIDLCKSYSHISKIPSEPDKGVYDTFYNENSIQDIVDTFSN